MLTYGLLLPDAAGLGRAWLFGARAVLLLFEIALISALYLGARDAPELAGIGATASESGDSLLMELVMRNGAAMLVRNMVFMVLMCVFV